MDPFTKYRLRTAEASERCWMRLVDAILEDTESTSGDRIIKAGTAFSSAMGARDRGLEIRYGRRSA